jgi:hypothetical protein
MIMHKTKDEQHIRLELTPEQLKTISANAKELSEGKIVIDMHDGKNAVGQIKVAECGYYSDSCCV